MSYISNYTGAEIDESVENYFNAKSNGGYIDASAILNLIYPVGSIYMSVNAVSPSTFIGGTWQAIEGKFLIGADSTYTSGSSGGNDTHTHTYVHTHTTPATTTDSHTLTVAEMPSHRHQEYYTWSGASNVGGNWKVNMTSTTNGGAGTWTHTSGLTDVGATGGGGGHTHGQKATTTDSQSTSTTSEVSNLPPYLAVYMWKRTA